MASATSLYVNWAEERVKSKEVVDGTTCRDELMQTEIQKVGCFIYILDCSNSSSITFCTSQFGSSSRSNWTVIWTGNSNGSLTDKQSSQFSTAKEMSVKATFFFI